MKPLTILLILGIACAGKGTLARGLRRRHDKTVHLIMSDMLKQNDRLRAIMAVGDLVSDEVVWELLKKPLSKHLEGKESIIVDGFPRTPVQMEMILSYLLGKHISYCVRVVHLTLTEEESRVRLELRAQAEGREDDMDPRAINNRIFKYRENYTKIVEKSINFGVRVHEVNGEKTEERVLNDVIKLI